jgi:colanic acid/amylovoran biosynthesis glycosyltransferase
MREVAHFKTNYLNLSETFIDRLVRNHVRYTPRILTLHKGHYTEGLNILEAPQSGVGGRINRFVTRLDWSAPFLYQALRASPPAIVHAHFGRDGFRVLHAARGAGLPLLISFYGHDVSRLPTRRLWRLRYAWLRHTRAHFTAATADLKRHLVEHVGFPESKISVVRVGLDFSKIEHRPRAHAGPRLLGVGRLVEKKGFRYAIEAVAALKASGHHVTLDLYGEGEARSELEATIARCNVADRVQLKGAQANSTIVSQLANYDVFLAPSVLARDGDREGTPQTIVEAMASGMPVVATPHAGIPELVEHEVTGLLAPERDVHGLAQNIRRLLAEPDLVVRLVAQGHTRARDHHSVSSTVAGTEAAYDRAIEEAAARHR